MALRLTVEVGSATVREGKGPLHRLTTLHRAQVQASEVQLEGGPSPLPGHVDARLAAVAVHDERSTDAHRSLREFLAE
jgi:hypothetical protein